MLNVVAAILKNNDNNILIAKRQQGKSMAGLWEFPGGKIEKGETSEEALIRELKEEMDIDIAIDNYFGENVHSHDTITIKLIAFQGSIVKGNIKLSVHDECRWVSIEELKNFNFAPADIYFVDKLMENK